jgi:hypothetical protein
VISTCSELIAARSNSRFRCLVSLDFLIIGVSEQLILDLEAIELASVTFDFRRHPLTGVAEAAQDFGLRLINERYLVSPHVSRGWGVWRCGIRAE